MPFNRQSNLVSRIFLHSSSRVLLAALMSVVAALGLSACGKNEKNENSEMRVFNLALDSPTLSIRVDDETDQWLSNIAFKAPTGFKTIKAGDRRLRVSDAGGVILDQSVSTRLDEKHMLIVYGAKSSVGMTLLNNDIAVSSSGKTRVRLFSVAVGLGTYDVYMTTASEDYRTVEPKARATAGATIELDSGLYTIRLTAPNTRDVLFEMPARALDSQKYYNLVLYNEGSGELPSAFWVEQKSDANPQLLPNPVSRVRATNAQAAIASVNVNIGGTRVFTNVPFGGVSSYARTASGAKNIAYVDSSNPASTFGLDDTLEGGRDYSTFLAPTLGGAPSVFLLQDRTVPPSSGKTRVRLVNATTVEDLALALSFTAVTSTVPVRRASDYVEVTSGDGTPVAITQGAAATPLVNLAGIDLKSGNTYSIVVSGTADSLRISSRQDN
jgi:hypothetical protein